ncbi:DUF262 domain-containing protein [Stutzerimonas marianensis]|uniref:DUF262 domain-containing protein n=1 Tax=Stutzerimonas marianensis TaxID=2929513 RepID=UPI003C2FA9B5
MEDIIDKYSNSGITMQELSFTLRTIRSRGIISSANLEKLISTQFDPISNYKKSLEILRNESLISKLRNDIRITNLGQKWLESTVSALELDEEDTSSSDTPTKPYEVAKLKMEPKYLSVFQALRKIEKHEIDLNPEFQRAFVWDIKKQSRLIESILIRIPLPAFYLDATDQVNWSVVDGLQRLTTLYNYCRKDSFKLSGMQFLTELEGLRFDELPAKYKVLIEDDTQLVFYNLMPGTPIEAKFTIFSRVNTGGMQLTPQEIRHALNQGHSTKLLHKISLDDRFRKATNGVVESLRMSDRELILRALAFMLFGASGYKAHSDLDSFLLRAMSEINTLSKKEIKDLEEKFFSSLEKVNIIFGRYSFRKFYERNGRRSPFNKALFEAWMVSVIKYTPSELTEHKEEIIDLFIEEMNKWDDFARSISSSTGSQSAVTTRFSRLAKILRMACYA